MKDTIVSISTPLGKGAISIVRMSGAKSLEIALKLFYAQNLFDVKPRYMYFGKIRLEDVYEECLMVYFKGPFSFTGEDIVEFQIHGGVLLAQKVVEVCLKNGARLAEAGEFSKRAFINGKITLDKAEAIIGEINAETEGELKSSLQVTNGKLASLILEQQEKLKLLIAELEVGMDYPDETDEINLHIDIKNRVEEINNTLKILIQQAESAKCLKNGINVALVGKTNVGKSSVMNALLGQNRAIVTDIQGTTRDSITESFIHKGIKINLVDTAGIRETEDIVENIGIEKSKKSLENADIILFVLDGSEKLTKEDEKIKNLLKNKQFITIINKTDKKRIVEKQQNELEISALQNKNIEELKTLTVETVVKEEIDFNTLVLTNERHVSVLKSAQNTLEDILKLEKSRDEFFEPSLEVIILQAKKAWQILGKITGNTENEDIINLIFSKFCLGK